MTEIVLIRNNKKKTIKISQISYFFPTHFLVYRKVRCPPKVASKPTSIHIHIFMSSYISGRCHQCFSIQRSQLLTISTYLFVLYPSPYLTVYIYIYIYIQIYTYIYIQIYIQRDYIYIFIYIYIYIYNYIHIYIYQTASNALSDFFLTLH